MEQFVISGTATNATFVLLQSNSPIDMTMAPIDANGNWSTTITIMDDEPDDDAPAGHASDTATITAIVQNLAGSAQASDDVIVDNVAPTTSVTASSPSDGFAELEIEIDDPSWMDGQDLTISWDDGTVEVYDYLGTGTHVFNHFYDNVPDGLPDKTYEIIVTQLDDDGGGGMYTASVTIDNLYHELVLEGPSMIDENSSASLEVYLEEERFSSATLNIDWGDGTSPETVAASSGFNTISHTYTDDNPSSSAGDNYEVTVTATDDVTLYEVTETVSLLVLNVEPQMTANDIVITYDASGNPYDATISGSYSDIGPDDTHTITIDWGDGESETHDVSGNSFSITRPLDPNMNPSDLYPTVVYIKDDDKGVASQLLAQNPPPGVITSVEVAHEVEVGYEKASEFELTKFGPPQTVSSNVGSKVYAMGKLAARFHGRVRTVGTKREFLILTLHDQETTIDDPYYSWDTGYGANLQISDAYSINGGNDQCAVASVDFVVGIDEKSPVITVGDGIKGEFTGSQGGGSVTVGISVSSSKTMQLKETVAKGFVRMNFTICTDGTKEVEALEYADPQIARYEYKRVHTKVTPTYSQWFDFGWRWKFTGFTP